jgi:hypothetical protein
MPHAVLLVLALVALVLLPCAVALLVINADRWRLRLPRGARLPLARWRRGTRRRPRLSPHPGHQPDPGRNGKPSHSRRRIWRITPQRSSWQERWMLIRLERALVDKPAEQRIVLDAMGRSDQLPIEQIASDLRRLGRQRLDLATRNPVWHEAVRRAYDDRLRLACGCLGITQHLAELDGVDLEIERVRVEGELHAAGLFFGGSDADRWQGHGHDRR